MILSDEIKRLSLDERLRLLEELWDSIAAEEPALPISPAFAAELDRRVEAIRQDPDGGLTWDEVKASIAGRP